MICLMLSKWVGDQFNISLYDLHVELKCIPFVEGTPSEGMEQMNAIDVATTPVVTLEQVRCRPLLAVSSDTAVPWPVTARIASRRSSERRDAAVAELQAIRCCDENQREQKSPYPYPYG